MESIHWSMTIGLTAGYSAERGSPPDLDAIGRRYQEVAAALADETGVYLSAILTPSRTLYREAWGCPPGGEQTVTFSGSCNPQFSDAAAYRRALPELAARLKEAFRQATVLLEAWPEDITYLTSDQEGSK